MRTTARLKKSLIKWLPFLGTMQRRLYHLKPYSWKFRTYYLDEGWGPGRESRSGPGSSSEKTAAVRAALPKLFSDHAIESIIDVPCGDFNWMKLVDLSGRTYLGIDIVPELVKANTSRYARPGVQFTYGDLLAGNLPKADLMLCRDLFGHYRNRDVVQALRNMKKSGSKYLLTTTYSAVETNADLEAIGLFRQFNLRRPPFDLPAPLLLLDEDEKHKCLGLWDLRTLPV